MNKHLEVIQSAMARIWDAMPESFVALEGGAELVDSVNNHAEAMAAELEAERARVARLQRVIQEWQIFAADDSCSADLGDALNALQHGDLPDESAP